MEKHALGWIPDYPDIRDYAEATEEVKSALGPARIRKTKAPTSVDLRQ